MTQDVADNGNEGAVAPAQRQSYRHLPWLRLPAPVKAIFDQFPLITYESNALPYTRAGSSRVPTLYVFTTEADARAGAPSYNPTCLKWQTYFRFCGIKFATHPSSNHASPTGALPFLLPSLDQGAKTAPVPTRQLRAWAERDGSTPDRKETGAKSKPKNEESDGADPLDLRYEAYASLLDHRIRSAYLHALYLCPSNFNAVTKPLYIEPTTSSSPVRTAQAHQLRNVARSELLKQGSAIDVEAVYRECSSAFEALSTLLAVFGYTNLLLDTRLQWKETRMRESLEDHQNLVSHRERISRNFFSAS